METWLGNVVVEELGVRLIKEKRMGASAYLKQARLPRARLYRLTHRNCLVIKPGSAGPGSEKRASFSGILVLLAMREALSFNSLS